MPARLHVTYFERIIAENNRIITTPILSERYICNGDKYITQTNAQLRILRALEHLSRPDDFNFDERFFTHSPEIQPLTVLAADANDQIIEAKTVVYLIKPRWL
jgi:hypothetical protein